MLIRNFKTIFVGLVALMCLFYGIQNVINLEACHQAFVYALGAIDHQIYSAHIIPPMGAGMAWVALVIVVGLEFAAGICAAKGSWDMWRARNGTADQFNQAKSLALVGCGIGVIIWLGLFAVVGGAVLIMWQTDAGRGSLENSFQFFATCALIFMMLTARDD